ncbi:transposable element Tc1 transposase [Trichonephila clavipes]|nr:transposable element Tc1 transposase [Trichonephila clavipes]
MATGSSLTQNYSRSQSEIQGDLHKRAKYLQKMQQLRSKFRIEYLGQLRQQVIKNYKDKPLSVGEIVLLEDNSKKHAYESGSVCVWDGISLGGRTDLHVFSHGNVNALTYRDDILDAYARPYDGEIGIALVQQDDNAKPHRPRIVDAYLEQETIQCPTRNDQLNHRTLTLSSMFRTL